MQEKYEYENQLNRVIQQYYNFIKSSYHIEKELYINLYSIEHQDYFCKFFHSLANGKEHQISIFNSKHASTESTDQFLNLTQKQSFYTMLCYIHK